MPPSKWKQPQKYSYAKKLRCHPIRRKEISLAFNYNAALFEKR